MGRGRPPIALPAKFVRMLGKATDDEVAQLAGVNKATIRARRIALGIAPFRRHANREPSLAEKIYLRHKDKRSQSEIAKLANVSRQRIHEIKKQHDRPKDDTPPSANT